MNKINVYDNYNIDLNKYPRKDIKYRICDIVLITFFMNIEKLKKICNCYNESYQNYNDCKEYYFFMDFDYDNKKLKKNYSAKEIIRLMKDINFDINSKNNLKKYYKLDLILYFYLKNKEFFEKLFNDLEKANIFYFQGRNYNVKFDVPNDFYNYKQSNVYSALELFEIYKYSQYLIKNKIIKNLPLPKYLID
jgi:hypothetical protein